MGPGAPAPAAVVRQRHGPHRHVERRRPHPRPRRADRHGGGRGARGDRLVRHRLRGQARRRARHPGGGADVFLLHVEATDEAGHAGNLDEKVKALEAWDTRILSGLVEGLDALGPWRLLLLPDHPTLVACARPTRCLPAGRQRRRRSRRHLRRGGHRRVPRSRATAKMLGRLLKRPGPGGTGHPRRAGLHRRCRPCFEPLGTRATVAPFCRGATVSSGRVTGQPPTPSQCEVVPLRTGRSATPRCLPPAYRRSTDPVSPEAVR